MHDICMLLHRADIAAKKSDIARLHVQLSEWNRSSLIWARGAPRVWMSLQHVPCLL